MTVQQLADNLDIDEKLIRKWLRKGFREAAPGSGRYWVVTPAMAAYCQTQAARVRQRR